MLSNSCRYGLRAVIYLASQPDSNIKVGIDKISKDLDLPKPFLAKILQQLVRKKILVSLKGPHGGFAIKIDPRKITLLDIVNTIDGEEKFTNCVLHNESCACVDKKKLPCAIHDDYSEIREKIIKLFARKTIFELGVKVNGKGYFTI